MDIYARAMRLEREGARIYRNLAGKALDSGIRSIFGWLAAQENRHWEIIRRMRGGHPVSSRPKVSFKRIRGVFRGIGKYASSADPSRAQAALYGKGLVVEERSVAFYARLARAAKDGRERKVLHWLTAEERKHAAILEGLIDFVTKPHRWVTSAEISHIGEDF